MRLKTLPDRAQLYTILFPALENSLNMGHWFGGMFIADEVTYLGGWKDGVLYSVLGEMLNVLPVKSQELCDVQTALGH